MTDMLAKYDDYLSAKGPAALVLREHLMPVEGLDGILFPPTFAASEDKTFKGGYNVDEFPDGKNVCLIDSVGSQANRIEPLFMHGDYATLVPQVVITAGQRKVNLLEAAHRAGDAIVRCSELQEPLRDAFQAMLRGNAEPLAKLAPTSLVFGAWDSRDTQAKMPRIVVSTIRAFDVRRLTRSAQYVPATDYVEEKLLAAPADKKVADSYASRGFVHVPASATPGGILATGGIRRDASLQLAALRLLGATDKDRTPALQRYILGLALTAFTAPGSGYLRQGCNLVRDPGKAHEFVKVHHDGRREPLVLGHVDALAYAKATAQAFGVGSNHEVAFNTEKASADVNGNSTGDKPKKSSKKAK